jgi:HSP20 family protein
MAKESGNATKERVPVRIEDPAAVASEVEQMHEKVLNRAFEIFNQNGSWFGRDLDNWLTAERELLWQPSVTMREEDHVYTVEASIAGVDPKDLSVEVTPNDLLIKTATHHEYEEKKGTFHLCEFASENLFRRVSFPEPVDTGKVEAVYKDGLLRLTAPMAATNGAKGPGPKTASF